MAAREIGNLSFEVFRGRPDYPAEGVECLERPGENYGTARRLGIRGQVATITTQSTVADAAAAQTLAQTAAAYVGSDKTIVDANGTTHANCLIVAASARVRTVLVGGVSKKLVTVHWTIRQGKPT